MKHKHAETIIAWANGEHIEIKPKFGGSWQLSSNPQWNLEYLEFRVKPKIQKEKQR